MKQYNIYKTMNLVNGKFYWGVHDSINENDGYFGSGEALLKALKKHGKENFRRVTKLLYAAAKDAYADEAFIVDSKMVKRKDCYNRREGGCGGSVSGEDNPNYGKPRPDWVKMKISIAHTGVLHSAERNKINSLAQKKRFENKENHPMFGKHHSEESKQKMRKPKSEEHIRRMRNRRVSEETKRKRRKTIVENGTFKGENNPMSKTNRLRRLHSEEVLHEC